MALTTNYTVSGGSGSTGTVTPVDGATDFPSTVEWHISRAIPRTQVTDLTENDAFPSASVEESADKGAARDQDIEEQLARCLKYPVSDPTSRSAELPNSIDRLSKYLGFDSSGDPTALDAPANTTVVSVFGALLIQATTPPAARALLVAQADRITTRGDVVYGDSTGVANRLALGASGQVLRSDGTDVAWATLVAGDLPSAATAYPRGHIGGLQTTRTSATLIDVAVGSCRAGSSSDPDLANFDNTTAAFGKVFDNGGWVAGDGNGGVPTAAGFAASAASWHFFALTSSDGGTDFGYDTSFTAANLVADAAVQAALGATVYYRRIWSFWSSATPDIPDYTQAGDECILATPVNENPTKPGASENLITLSVPTGFRLRAIVNPSFVDASSDSYVAVYSPGTTMSTPSGTNGLANMANENGTHGPSQRMIVLTNTSGQIGTWASQVLTSFDLGLTGWIDDRGRND